MSNEYQEKSDGEVIWGYGIKAVLGLIAFVAVMMAIRPTYHVYSQRLEGQAILAHAQSSREVAVAEAKAKMESAELLAQAEVKRAEGVAKANQIIGQSLKDNDSYLRYLWITEVAGRDIDKTVVYIPTEANIPIMEAGRSTKK